MFINPPFPQHCWKRGMVKVQLQKNKWINLPPYNAGALNSVEVNILHSTVFYHRPLWWRYISNKGSLYYPGFILLNHWSFRFQLKFYPQKRNFPWTIQVPLSIKRREVRKMLWCSWKVSRVLYKTRKKKKKTGCRNTKESYWNCAAKEISADAVC